MKKVKIQIKNRWTGSVLFVYEKENNTNLESIQEAVKRGADLRDADLVDADLRCAGLRCADLRCADLRGADLRGADLRCAHLRGADLVGADLRCAHLRGADLVGVDLRGADLGGVDLRGAGLGNWGIIQDILIIGYIGSRNDYTTVYKTHKGIFVQCGCYKGSLDEFVAKVKETHQGNKHERDYLALVEFAKIKFEI